MPGEAQKIDLHRRLALAESEDELRELRAATEDRFGPIPGARREPVRDPGGEAEARSDRRRLPRLPRRPGRRRAARPRARRSCASFAPRRPTAVYSSAKRELTQQGRRVPGGARAGRCYPRFTAFGLACTAPCLFGLVFISPARCARPRRRSRRAVAAATTTSPRRTSPPTRSPSSATARSPSPSTTGSWPRREATYEAAQAGVPRGRDARVRAAPQRHRHAASSSRPSSRSRPRSSASTVTDDELDKRARRAEAAVLRGRRGRVPGRS